MAAQSTVKQHMKYLACIVPNLLAAIFVIFSAPRYAELFLDFGAPLNPLTVLAIDYAQYLIAIPALISVTTYAGFVFNAAINRVYRKRLFMSSLVATVVIFVWFNYAMYTQLFRHHFVVVYDLEPHKEQERVLSKQTPTILPPFGSCLLPVPELHEYHTAF